MTENNSSSDRSNCIRWQYISILKVKGKKRKENLKFEIISLFTFINWPIYSLPAMKNGMATCTVVCHHFSCLILVSAFSPLSSLGSFPEPPPLVPGSETKEVAVIELSEPVVEAGRTESLSSSPGEQAKENWFQKNNFFCLFFWCFIRYFLEF